MSTTLILPCCGDSTRFPGSRPKFLLTHPLGGSMLSSSIFGLDFDETTTDVIAVVRADHVKKYKFTTGISDEFKSDSFDFRWCILSEPTKSQPETIAKCIEQENIEGQIAIKDCDNYFECDVPTGNYVAVSRLQDHKLINPSNKSYVACSNKRVLRIAEKEIISDTFSCGLYCFENAKYFKDLFYHLDSICGPGLYISHMIENMVQSNIPFKTEYVKHYTDWGTLEDWNRYKNGFETIFVDLDGVLVENSAKFLDPKWGTTGGITENIKYLQSKYLTGKVDIIITTSRTKDFDKVTRRQLKHLGIPYDRIIYGLHHGRRVLVNDYAPSNPYPSCYAVNVPRNAPILGELMK